MSVAHSARNGGAIVVGLIGAFFGLNALSTFLQWAAWGGGIYLTEAAVWWFFAIGIGFVAYTLYDD